MEHSANGTKNASAFSTEQTRLLPARAVESPSDNDDESGYGADPYDALERQVRLTAVSTPFLRSPRRLLALIGTTILAIVVVIYTGSTTSRPHESSTSSSTRSSRSVEAQHPPKETMFSTLLTFATPWNDLDWKDLHNHDVLLQVWDEWKRSLRDDNRKNHDDRNNNDDDHNAMDWWHTIRVRAEPLLGHAKDSVGNTWHEAESAVQGTTSEWHVGEKLRSAQEATSSWAQQTGQQAQNDVRDWQLGLHLQQAEHAAAQLWNSTLQKATEVSSSMSASGGAVGKEWLGDTQDWLHAAWNGTEQTAEHAWGTVEDEAQRVGPQARTLWNHTAQTEGEWYNHVKNNLRHLGSKIRGWWGVTERAAVNETGAMEDTFQNWWKQANGKERAWWNDTVHAYHVLAQKSERAEASWWNATRETVGHGWNATTATTDEAWESTQRWFRARAHVTQNLEEPLLYLNSSRAYSLLRNAQYGWYEASSDFFEYQTGWDVQINQAYCGVAAAVAVWNSIRSSVVGANDAGAVEAAMDPSYEPYVYATQSSLIHNKCVHHKVIRHNATFDGILHVPGGLSLVQTADLLTCTLPSSSWTVTTHYVVANTTTLDDVRADLQQALLDPKARVYVNYDRSVLDQHGGGHFSPLGSYASRDDAFLLLDVAKYKYPSAWIPAARLFAAMSGIDVCGTWDYPHAQDSLPVSLLKANSTKAYARALTKLGCKPLPRGYVIVRSITEDTGNRSIVGT